MDQKMEETKDRFRVEFLGEKGRDCTIIGELDAGSQLVYILDDMGKTIGFIPFSSIRKIEYA
jgi:hypothetical protein